MNTIEMAYKNFCRKRFPLPSEKQVADLEEELGILFPPDYRDFLFQYNGGFFTNPEIAPSCKECPLDGLDVLYGIGATHPSVELNRGCACIFDDNDPPQIMGIGYTTMGNLIFLVTDITGDDWGQIALKLMYSSTSFNLGNGIEEFFSRLYRDPTNI